MTSPWGHEYAGRVEHHTITSELLRGNPLGDPHERPVQVYLPPGYDDSDARYPTIYSIQGFTGHVSMWGNRAAFRTPYPELVDRLFAAGDVPPALVVFADCWTSLGGSQYVDSPATGRYHSYLCDEVVPWVDARYRTLDAPEHRAITGKSSGGYGAMITPMLRPDLFGGLATHAGDALFECTYQQEFPMIARMLRDDYGGSWEAFLADFRSGRPFGTKPSDSTLIEMYAYSACFSADEDGTVRIPFDEVGRPIPEVWERWLALDPVRMVPRYADAVRSLTSIWIDAGTRDEWYLDFGAAAYKHALEEAGVKDDAIHFELFDDGHGAIEYRYPMALAWLAERLAP